MKESKEMLYEKVRWEEREGGNGVIIISKVKKSKLKNKYNQKAFEKEVGTGNKAVNLWGCHYGRKDATDFSSQGF